MAVSNAIGSNVFDILIGLGLPWTIATLCLGRTVSVDASNLFPMVVVLLSSLVIVFGTVLLSGFVLNKAIGVFFFAIYLAFCAMVLLQEFGVLAH
jgi:Ca2+/Na+ antiporter